METVEVVAAVIRDADGRILRARRRADLRSGGLWEFPGGKVEYGESLLAALEREILEELGVPIRAGGLLCITESATHGGLLRLHCLWAELIDGPPTGSTDHDVLEWVAPRELPLDSWCTPDEEAVAMLRAGARPSPFMTR